MAEEKLNLNLAVKTGAGWVLMMRGTILLVDFVTSVVLARLLSPAEFGVVACALIFTGLATRLVNLGFPTALVRMKEVREDHIISTFTITLGWHLTIGAFLALLSPFLGMLFENGRVEDGVVNDQVGWIGMAIASTFLTTPFSSISRALLQRRMNFKYPSTVDLVNHLVTNSIAIYLAATGWGVWSLVWGRVAAAFVAAALLVIFSGWIPRLGWRKEAMKDLTAYGYWITAKNLVFYATDNVDNLIVGKFLGKHALGFYDKAYTLMNLTGRDLLDMVAGVMLSAFAKIQKERGRMRHAYRKVLLAVSLLAFPVPLGLQAVAPEFIRLVYGEKWLPSVLPLQIMCIAAIFRIHVQVASTVVNAAGKVKWEVAWRLGALVLVVAGALIGSRWGIVGVSTAVTVANAILMLSIVALLLKLLGAGIKDFILPQLPAFSGSVSMAVSVAVIRALPLPLHPHSPGRLAAMVTGGAAAYVLGAFLPCDGRASGLVKELWRDFRPLARRCAPREVKEEVAP